jgi:hypothetical protein
MQVTLNGLPLYTFAPDKNPGDATGDGLNDFGGIWHVVSLGGTSTSSSSDNHDPGGYEYDY